MDKTRNRRRNYDKGGTNIMRIYLEDDVNRTPDKCKWMDIRIGSAKAALYQKPGWTIVRNYDDFVETIKEHAKYITHVSFDHDLAYLHYEICSQSQEVWEGFHNTEHREKTGFDCAKWMKEFYEETGRDLPEIYVHSLNPVGMKNILNVFGI